MISALKKMQQREELKAGQMRNGIEMTNKYSLRRWPLNGEGTNEEKRAEGRVIHSGGASTTAYQAGICA